VASCNISKKEERTVVMGNVFWNVEGCILVDLFRKGKPLTWLTTFTCPKNCDLHFIKSDQWKRLLSFNTTLHDLTQRIWQWRQSQSTAGKCSHIHHTAQTWVSHLFGILKDHMRGQHYENDDTVQEATHSWMQGAGTDFYHSAARNLW